MSSIVFGLFNWVDQSFSSFREYISGSTENTAHDSGVAEEVKDDHGVVNRRGSKVMDEKKAFNTVSDGKPQVISINLPSNSGTVVIGDNPHIRVDNLPLVSKIYRGDSCFSTYICLLNLDLEFLASI